MQAHPSASKLERKSLCRLIDSRKLSPEASLHAAQNERLPVRAVIQVLFSEQSKLSRNINDWSGSFSGTRSPNLGLEPPARCMSKREMSVQQMEIRRLKEDVLRLQSQCNNLQVQMERMQEKKQRGGYFFKWRRFGLVPSFKSGTAVSVVGNKIEESHDEEDHDHEHHHVVGFERPTPMMNMKTKLVRGRTPPKWRRSMS